MKAWYGRPNLYEASRPQHQAPLPEVPIEKASPFAGTNVNHAPKKVDFKENGEFT
jgi:hypothetical protein